MKSTVRVDFESGNNNLPIIKIITPIHGDVNICDDDYDPKDQLIAQLFLDPKESKSNRLFGIRNAFLVNDEKRLIMLGPIRPSEENKAIRQLLLERYVPQATMQLIMKAYREEPSEGCGRSAHPGELEAIRIREFFDWLETIEPTREGPETDRRIFF